jgi:hypothetical protein
VAAEDSCRYHRVDSILPFNEAAALLALLITNQLLLTPNS